jgi:ADP-ribose pyrophosphatase
MPPIREIHSSPGLSCNMMTYMKIENPETAILERNEPYRGKIINLMVDTIELASGARVIREVVMHPGGVTAVPVLDDGRILLIRQFRYPLQKFILELPAGKLDSGQSPEDTIARELEEESGYHADSLEYKCFFYTSPGISNEMIHFFIARNLSPVSPRPEEGEHITVEAHTIEECLKKIQSGEITDGKTILGILWYRMNSELKSAALPTD